VNGRLLMVAVLLLALLAAFYYFVDIRGRESRDLEEAAGRRLVAEFDPQQVRSLVITGDDGPDLRVERGGPETPWLVVSPLESEADPDAVQRLLQALGRLTTLEEPFQPADGELAAFGLLPPQLTVTVAGEGDAPLARLALGSPAPLGAASYALHEESGRVGLVGEAETRAIPRTLFDLRRKRLVRFRREEVREVRIETADQPLLKIRRLGDDWEIVDPLQFAADRELVVNLLWELAECRAVGFPEARETADLDWIGAGRVGLTLADGSLVEAVLAGDGERLHAVGDTGTVMLVEPTLLQSLGRPAGEWRQLRPFPRYAWEVDRLTVAPANADPVNWHKGDDGAWQRDGEAAAEEDLQRALELLTALEACGLAAGDGPPPDFTVSLTGGSEAAATVETLEIGFPGEGDVTVPGPCQGSEYMLYGRRPEGNLIYVMDEPARDELRDVLLRLCADTSGGDASAGE